MKRGIAGTLVFTVFDRDALIEGLKDHVNDNTHFQRVGNENNMKAMTISEWDKNLNQMVNGSGTSSPASKRASTVTQNIADHSKSFIYYADEIPPFDVTISFANEYGQKAALVIYGVELLNEGTGFSVDSVSSEKACTFVARKVAYMRPVTSDTQDSVFEQGAQSGSNNYTN